MKSQGPFVHGRPRRVHEWYRPRMGRLLYRKGANYTGDKGWRREHAKAVCGAWLGLFNFMAMTGAWRDQLASDRGDPGGTHQSVWLGHV